MKKIIAFLLLAVLCVSFAACGGNPEAKETPTPTENAGSAGIQVDEGLFSVDVTMPESFFDDMTEEEIKENAEEKGISKCVVNEDGSVTYTMTKSRHNELLKELKENLTETIAGLTEGEDAVESFVSVDYTDDFSRFDVEVNDQYSSWDNLYALTFYVSGAYYQAFSGKSAEEIDVVVNFIDSETEEILSTASYREWLSALQDEEGEENGEGESTENEPADAAGTPLTVGETITLDDECEFSLDYVSITKDVLPPAPGSWYSHYEAEAGKTYVDVCVAYKNLDVREKAADEVMSAVLTYAGKYEYKGFSMIEEDSRGDFTYSNITNIAPLATEYLHYLFEVPEVVGSSEDSLRVRLTIAGSQYDITVRDGADGEGDTPGADAVVKTEGTVRQGELVAIRDNCEFQVDYANITSDVVPPQPGDWYSHYQADDGKVYVDFCVAYKNWKTGSVDADEVMSAVLTYAGKYEYKGFSMIEEDSRGDFTYSNITSIAPLATEYLHYLFEVPEDVEKTGDSIEIEFTIAGNSYSYTVR